jgi:outer membrane protein assembly factor BamB
MRPFTIAVTVTTVFSVTLMQAEDWPQFRGPRGDGTSRSTELPTTWGGFLEPPVWKSQLPGIGWSSPIVLRDRIWVSAAEQTALGEESQEQKLSDHPYGDEVFQTHASVNLLVVELDVATGGLLRRIDLQEVDDPTPIHVTNSYASPTPITDGERVYCDYGSLGTFCVSVESGEVVWQQKLEVDDITGPACSPVLWEDLLILVRDGCDRQTVLALDKETGKTRWSKARPSIDVVEDKHRRAFSTPLVIRHGGRAQLIAPTAQWIVSYDPSDGQEIWRARMEEGHALIPRPVYAKGIAYVCSGYMQPKLYAVRVDGTGDVTDTHVLWIHARQVPLISSPVLDGSEIYFVSNIGVASCLDAQTGEQLWQQRLSGNYAASPLLADGKLYFTSVAGVTTVLRAGREYEELAKNRLFGRTMASLAVAGDSLLIRTADALYCLRKSPHDGLLRGR